LPVSGFTVPGAGALADEAGLLAVFSHKAKSRASARPAVSQATPIAFRKWNQASSSWAYDLSDDGRASSASM